MRKRSLVYLGLIVFSSSAMTKRPLEQEESDIPMKQMQELEITSKARKAAAESLQAPKELSEQTKKQIKFLQEQAALGKLSNEILANILINLAKEKVRGATEEHKLYTVITNIRYFMTVFPQFYSDVKINGDLIEELAKRYTGNRRVVVAIALATTGAGQWLAAFVGNDDYRERLASTELVRAAEYDQTGTIRFILTYVPQTLNKVADVGLTALMRAAEFDRAAIVEQLLRLPGIDVNAQATSGDTVLMLAAHNDRVNIIECLLKVPGIKVNVQNELGGTALMIAAQNGFTSVVERLLQAPGINVNLQLQDGRSVLMIAAQDERLSVVERLLQVPGIIINARSKVGLTALGYAQRFASQNRDAIIKLLVAHGATE